MDGGEQSKNRPRRLVRDLEEITFVGTGNWADMAPIHLAECDEASVLQIWDVMEDGRIAIEASAPPRKLPPRRPHPPSNEEPRELTSGGGGRTMHRPSVHEGSP